MIGRKILFAALGFIATGLGIIGVWLPGLPTTVFILIALWAFSQVSPRLERWLEGIPLLKQAIGEAKRFQNEGTVSRSSKLISQGCSWLSFAFIALFLPHPVVVISVGLLAVSCSVFMWKVPTAEQTISPKSSAK